MSVYELDMVRRSNTVKKIIKKMLAKMQLLWSDLGCDFEKADISYEKAVKILNDGCVSRPFVFYSCSE